MGADARRVEEREGEGEILVCFFVLGAVITSLCLCVIVGGGARPSRTGLWIGQNGRLIVRVCVCVCVCVCARAHVHQLQLCTSVS